MHRQRFKSFFVHRTELSLVSLQSDNPPAMQQCSTWLGTCVSVVKHGSAKAQLQLFTLTSFSCSELPHGGNPAPDNETTVCTQLQNHLGIGRLSSTRSGLWHRQRCGGIPSHWKIPKPKKRFIVQENSAWHMLSTPTSKPECHSERAHIVRTTSSRAETHKGSLCYTKILTD